MLRCTFAKESWNHHFDASWWWGAAIMHTLAKTLKIRQNDNVRMLLERYFSSKSEWFQNIANYCKNTCPLPPYDINITYQFPKWVFGSRLAITSAKASPYKPPQKLGGVAPGFPWNSSLMQKKNLEKSKSPGERVKHIAEKISQSPNLYRANWVQNIQKCF